MLPDFLKAHSSFMGRGEYVDVHGNRKAMLLAYPDHITVIVSSGQTVQEFSSIYPRSCRECQCRGLVTTAQFAFRATPAVISSSPPKYHCCLIHWAVGNLPAHSKVAGDKDEPQQIWE